jgi:hypothetical protein
MASEAILSFGMPRGNRLDPVLLMALHTILLGLDRLMIRRIGNDGIPVFGRGQERDTHYHD